MWIPLTSREKVEYNALQQEEGGDELIAPSNASGWSKGRRRTLVIVFICCAAVTVLVSRKWHSFACEPAYTSVSALRCHHRLGKKKLEVLLASQSSTTEQAIKKYKKRYNRDPPVGFEDWVEYALANEAPIIDTYDQLEADLLPLRQSSANTIKARIEAATSQHDKSLSRAGIRDGRAFVEPLDAKNEAARTMESILRRIEKHVPDVEWLVNWDDRNRVRGATENSTAANERLVQTVNYDEVQVWNGIRSACPAAHIAVNVSLMNTDRPSIDVCQMPDSYRSQHGVFNSFLGAINTTIPVVSIGKLSTFQDIVAVPPWCYASDNYRVREPQDLLPFEEKKDTLYWRGSSTGLSRSTLENWRTSHRARILLTIEQMRNESRKDVWMAEAPRETFTGQQQSALRRLKHSMFDVGYTRIDLCNDSGYRSEHEAGCRQIESFYPLAQQRPTAFAFEHKFLLDIDGNSMSCRFYRLLGAGSVVFKQTVWAEWHDDRMIPFIHYVPLALDIKELPLYMDMMTNTKEGRAIAKEIAENARSWSETALRRVDMSVTYYRFILELAKILHT